jgi:hypothetical protein
MASRRPGRVVRRVSALPNLGLSIAQEHVAAAVEARASERNGHLASGLLHR